MYEKVIIICGMPRSGTSWMGQIFDSSPEVAFRMEPLFSYRYKNIINKHSSRQDIVGFLKDVYQTDDDFIHQRDKRVTGTYASFEKEKDPKILVIKTTRHHELLETYLKLLDNIHIVAVVRHPCAVINSWINTDREFTAKGCAVEKDWRSGGCRKGEEGEYWGFDDWLGMTRLHVDLAAKYENFNIVNYSELVRCASDVVSRLFTSMGISFGRQTQMFLEQCNTRHDADPYSVFKMPHLIDDWQNKLDDEIVREMMSDSEALGLGEFLT